MNKVQLQATVETLQNLYAREDELKQAIREQEQILKDHMDNEHIEHLDLGIAVVHFTQVISKVFDLKKFSDYASYRKAALPVAAHIYRRRGLH